MGYHLKEEYRIQSVCIQPRFYFAKTNGAARCRQTYTICAAPLCFMENEEALRQALRKTIYGVWTYSSKSRKYHSKDSKKNMSLEDALKEIKLVFSDNFATLLASVTTEDFKSISEDILKEAVQTQKEKRLSKVVSQVINQTPSSSMDSKVEVNPLWRPKTTFNRIDALWCKNLLRYNDVLYHKNPNGSLKVLGGLSAQYRQETIDRIISHVEMPDLNDFCNEKVNLLTVMQRELDAKDCGERDTVIAQLSRTVGDIIHRKNRDAEIYNTTLKDFLDIKDVDEENIMSMDDLSTKLVYKFLNDLLPASIQFGLMKVVKSYDQFSTDDSTKKLSVFNGFFIQTKGDYALTKSAYFEHILVHHRDNIESINYNPLDATMDDDPTYSFGKFNRKLFEEDCAKYGDLKYQDSQIIKTFAETMDKDQIKWTFAWYYALFFLLTVVISKCHIDGGGTLKTTVKNLVTWAMHRYFGANLAYPMIREQLINPANRYDDKRKISLAECRLCPYDEPAVKGELWETFKGLTGNPTLEMPVKILFRNTSSLPTRVLFDIGSNKQIFISDGGAFERRIAFIRTAAKNTCRKIPQDRLKELTTFDKAHWTMTDDQLREFMLLIRIGKQAYEDIVSEYGSLELAAVGMPTIAKFLKEANPWDAYYGDLYNLIFSKIEEKDGKEHEFIRIANEVIEREYKQYCIKHTPPEGASVSGFKAFFKRIDNRNDGKVFKVGKKSCRGWILYKLENSSEDVIEASEEELFLSNKEPVGGMFPFTSPLEQNI